MSQQKNPNDSKLLESVKKSGSLTLGVYNSSVENHLKNQIRDELAITKKVLIGRPERKTEPEIHGVIQDVFQNKFRKIKTFTQMSQKGFNPRMKKPNQDISFICPNFADQTNYMLMAVCDGHGSYGHDVSAFLEKTLPTIFSKELSDKLKSGDAVNFTKVFEKSFQITNVKLKNDINVDSSLSGATCVTVLYKGDKFICGNIGDSRAVVGRCVDGSN